MVSANGLNFTADAALGEAWRRIMRASWLQMDISLSGIPREAGGPGLVCGVPMVLAQVLAGLAEMLASGGSGWWTARASRGPSPPLKLPPDFARDMRRAMGFCAATRPGPLANAGRGLLFRHFVVGKRIAIGDGTRDCRVRIAIGHSFTNAGRHFWARFRAQDNPINGFWRKLK